jgi:hypothetical protein
MEKEKKRLKQETPGKQNIENQRQELLMQMEQQQKENIILRMNWKKNKNN